MNHLLLNHYKTKIVLFGMPQLLSRIPQDITFTLMDKELKASSTSKDLGIILDTCLSYNDHVTNLVSSCMSSLSQINRIHHLFERKMLIMIINSLVFSKLYYCSIVWASI